MYLVRVLLLIIKPNFFKYSIQDVSEPNFKVWSESKFTKVFPAEQPQPPQEAPEAFIIFKSTGILLRVPNM